MSLYSQIVFGSFGLERESGVRFSNAVSAIRCLPHKMWSVSLPSHVANQEAALAECVTSKLRDLDLGLVAVSVGRFQAALGWLPLAMRFFSLLLPRLRLPNQPLEPTSLLVMPRADARVTPSSAVAHL